MKKKLLIVFLSILVIAGGYYFLKPKQVIDKEEQLFYTVKKGDFNLIIHATGELQAKNSKKIMGPSGMQSVGIFRTTIDRMVPEGTVVKKGEYVASLNRDEIANKLKEVSTEIEKILTQLEQARLDTAIELRAIRDQIVNHDFAKKEKEIQVQQSQFEPQMVIRQAQLELEKTDRALQQTTENLKLKEQQAKARIQEITTTLTQQQNRLAQLNAVAEGFTVRAPDDGMVIYYRTWGGKVSVGSQLNAWDPVVAELPDLSDMISKAYVNEVDINKIRVGLDATIKVDALPEKTYTGKVIKVANMGEDLRGYDSKVFEVIIQITEIDSLMRPAMTTGAEIFVDDYPDVLSIPIEALHVDSLSFVYKKAPTGIVYQEVITGMVNDMMVIIEEGVQEGDVILLNPPKQTAKIDTQLIPQEIKDEIKSRQEEEKKRRQENYAKKAEETRKNIPDYESNGGSTGGIIIFN